MELSRIEWAHLYKNEIEPRFTRHIHNQGTFPNDGRDAFLVMSSAYYDRTCLWSADIFTLLWQENF